MNEVKNCVEELPTMELAINSLPNGSMGYSPFFLNYGYHPTLPADLLCGKVMTNNEAIESFFQQMKDAWNSAYENMRKLISLQAKYYNEQHKMINYEVNDLVL